MEITLVYYTDQYYIDLYNSLPKVKKLLQTEEDAKHVDLIEKAIFEREQAEINRQALVHNKPFLINCIKVIGGSIGFWIYWINNSSNHHMMIRDQPQIRTMSVYSEQRSPKIVTEQAKPKKVYSVGQTFTLQKEVKFWDIFKIVKQSPTITKTPRNKRRYNCRLSREYRFSEPGCKHPAKNQCYYQ